MEDCESGSRNGDHDTVKDDELSFVAHDIVAPATRHLRDTVDASSEDGGVCDNDTGEEELELQVMAEGCGGRRESAAVAVDTDEVFGKEEAEDGEDDDLEDDTGKHQIASNVNGV